MNKINSVGNASGHGRDDFNSEILYLAYKHRKGKTKAIRKLS